MAWNGRAGVWNHHNDDVTEGVVNNLVVVDMVADLADVAADL